MKRLLGRGLNFSVLPKKLDTTQVMVDFERFKRSMIWSEFMYGREEQEELQSDPIFKSLKTNLPKKTTVSLKILKYSSMQFNQSFMTLRTGTQKNAIFQKMKSLLLRHL